MQKPVEEILTTAQTLMVEHAQKHCDDTVEKIFIYAVNNDGFMFFKMFGITHPEYSGENNSTLVYETPKHMLQNFSYEGIDVIKTLEEQLTENGYPIPQIMRLEYSIPTATLHTELEYETTEANTGYLSLDQAYIWKDMITKKFSS